MWDARQMPTLRATQAERRPNGENEVVWMHDDDGRGGAPNTADVSLSRQGDPGLKLVQYSP